MGIGGMAGNATQFDGLTVEFEDIAINRQFAESEGYAKFFIGCADGTVIADYYPSDYIPYTVLVRNGIVEETMVGTHSFDDYRKMIDRYLEK